MAAAQGNSDHTRRQTPNSTFPAHPPLDQFPSGPLHTPFNGLPLQYVTPAHPPPFQNHPSHPHMYHGYQLLGPSSYPPPHYLPLLRRQSRPYLPHQSTAVVENGSPPYQQAQHLPPPMPQFATSGPASDPSYAAPYGQIQQYPPHLYSAPGHFGLPQQYQPAVYQWHRGLGSSVDQFIDGDPIQLQQCHPMIYSYPHTQRPHTDSHTLRAQPTGLVCPPSPGVGPSGSPVSITASQNTTSPTAGDSSEHIPTRSSQKMSTHQPSQRPTASISHARDRPPVRRQFHPGPPPNRSEWVMWVGNVPSDATNDELWRFLKQPVSVHSGPGDAEDGGVLSVFLISRSNCAFINYQSEEHLGRAISQFNGRKLRPLDNRCPRLVCRARRKEDDLRAGVGAQRGMGLHTHYVKNVLQKGNDSFTTGGETTLSKDHRPNPPKASDPPPATSAAQGEEDPKSDIVEGESQKIPTRSPSSYASTSSSFLARHFPKRFFILKSLTRYDLDLSTERGVWATQKHNEAILDQAFRTSLEVILIFSVNRSGEFYGYARMASGISHGNRSVSWAPRADPPPSTSSPSTSCTPVYGSSEQFESPSRHGQTYTSPPGHRFGPAFPFAPCSPDGTKEGSTLASSSPVRVTQERRSAPLGLDHASDSEELASPDLPPRSAYNSTHEGQCQVPQDDPPSNPNPELGEYPGMRATARSKGGSSTGDSSNLGLRLLPVVEEAHAENGVDGNQPLRTAMLSAAMHGHPEARERAGSWGETFKIEWLCTTRIQFHRTRHLRNPWNHGREIKVSRDGTELEPSVGQRLIDLWPTLVREPANSDDTRRPAAFAGRGGGKVVSKPGPPLESKNITQKPP